MFAAYGDDPIEGESIRRAFISAQKKIEGFNFDNRKSVLNFDDVIRQQRDLIYEQRDLILERDDLSTIINKMINVCVTQIVDNPFFTNKNNALDFKVFVDYINRNWMNLSTHKFTEEELVKLDRDDLISYITNIFRKEYAKLRQNIVEKYNVMQLTILERNIILEIFDQAWQDHINVMDKLRRNAHLVQYSQKNPYQVYTNLGSKKFKELTNRIALESVVNLMNNYEATPANNYKDSNVSSLLENTNINLKENKQLLDFLNSIFEHEKDKLLMDGKSPEEVNKIVEEKKKALIGDFKITVDGDTLTIDNKK